MNQIFSKVKKRATPGYIIVSITILVAVFYSGFFAGHVSSDNFETLAIEDGELVNRNVKSYAKDDVDFNLFWEVWDTVKENYVMQPVSEVDLFYGAVQGMVTALEDPYSLFFNPEETEEFNKDLDGTFYGIGAEIGIRDDLVMVEAPLPNGPAIRNGIMAGDLILAVDGEDTFGLTVHEAVMKIRGELGAPVTLTVLHEGEEETSDIVIVREEIVIDSVEWEVRDDGIAVISIYMFNADTTSLFNQAVQEILREDAESIIVDLRNNRGGLLDSVVKISDFWINSDIVAIERTNSTEFTLATNPGAILSEMPTVVLVNGGSASASEILAGALQDYGLATLIGETTFGKGVVQEFREFDNGSALKVTVAEWLTPAGRAINKVGIEPDIVAEFTIDDFNEKRTPQLEAAIDYLKGQ